AVVAPSATGRSPDGGCPAAGSMRCRLLSARRRSKAASGLRTAVPASGVGGGSGGTGGLLSGEGTSIPYAHAQPRRWPLGNDSALVVTLRDGVLQPGEPVEGPVGRVRQGSRGGRHGAVSWCGCETYLPRGTCRAKCRVEKSEVLTGQGEENSGLSEWCRRRQLSGAYFRPSVAKSLFPDLRPRRCRFANS